MQFQTVRRSRDPPRCESRALPRVADDGEMIGRVRREYRRLTMRPKASKAPPWSARRKSEREAASHFISISSALPLGVVGEQRLQFPPASPVVREKLPHFT